MGALYHEILYRPIFNILVWLYLVIPWQDMGIAIILLTFIYRFLFFPLSVKAQRSQRALSALNPEIKEIKEKFKNDRQAQSEAIMNLYKERKVSPFGGCLPILIQLPVIFALYGAFSAGLKPESLNLLYSFIPRPEDISHLFLGTINITTPNHVLTIVAAIAQYGQSLMSTRMMKRSGSMPKEMAAINTQMMYFLPLIVIVIGWRLPAGLILYWIATTIFSLFEQWYVYRDASPKTGVVS